MTSVTYFASFFVFQSFYIFKGLLENKFRLSGKSFKKLNIIIMDLAVSSNKMMFLNNVIMLIN